VIDSSRLYALAAMLDDYISDAFDAGDDVNLVRCALDGMEEHIVHTLNQLGNQLLKDELRRSIAEKVLAKRSPPPTETPAWAKRPF